MAGPGWMWNGVLALGLTAAFIGLRKFLDIRYRGCAGRRRLGVRPAASGVRGSEAEDDCGEVSRAPRTEQKVTDIWLSFITWAMWGDAG